MEYFRQNSLNIASSMHLLFVYLYTPAFHVENVAREYQAIEVEEVEPEFQGEQQPGEEYAVADQVEDQALESNFANPDSQQGKHRCILTQYRITV